MASVPFNNLITFSRGSNATVTGSNGLIQWAPNNLLLNSEQFDSAGWGRDDVTVTANTAVAPDGTTTADTVIPSTLNSATHRVRQAVSTSVATHSISVYVKAFGYSKFGIREGNVTGAYGTFNLSTGTVIDQGSGGTATILSVGNGWYRCSVSFTAGATARADLSPLDDAYTSGPPTAYSYAGNGTSGVFIWGAQLELGSAATTYNSTTVKNLLGFSEAFDNAAWAKLGSSLVTGAQANPVNGAFNAQKLMEDTSNAIHRTFQTVTIAAAPYTFSFYAKPAGRDWIFVNAGGAYTAYVNIATGAIGVTTGSPTITMTPLSGGWYRVAMTYQNATAAATTQQIWLASNSTTNSYTGDGNSGVYIYGAQLSDSASLDPYVPTPAAAPSSTAYYGPRFDYDPVTLQPKGLLVEEARTNLLTFSEDFTSTAGWSNVSAGIAVVIANNATAPDGTLTADRLTFGGINTWWGKPLTFVNGTTYASSLWVKVADGGGDFTITLTFYPTGGGTIQDIVVNVTSGWARVNVVFPTVAIGASTSFFVIKSQTTRAIYVWGAQVEAGAFATSYIPTVASTVTRSADVATINGSLFSQWYAQSEGTFVLNADVSSSSGFSFVGLSAHTPGGTSNNRVLDITSAVARTYVYASGTLTGAMLSLGSVTPNVPFKQATAYASATNNAVLNGASAQTAAVSPNPTTITVLGIGVRQDGTVYSAGHIRSIDYIPARAADFQLQALTTT